MRIVGVDKAIAFRHFISIRTRSQLVLYVRELPFAVRVRPLRVATLQLPPLLLSRTGLHSS